MQGKGEDAIIKLRPVVPHELPSELRRSPSFNVEVDAMPGGYVCSGTLKSAVKEGCVVEHIHGERPLRKVFSKEQRAFFTERAPSGVTFDDLVILGPIFVLKLKFSPDELSRRLVTEMWLYPDGSRILELSTRCTTTDAFEAAAEVRAFLTERGVDANGEQQTKTRTALEFFARELAGTPPVVPAS